MSNLEWNREHWNDPLRWRHEWENGYRWGDRAAVLRDFRRFVEPFLPEEREGSILEIGCGMGRFTELLLEAVDRVHAIDLAEHCVESTRRRFSTERLTTSLTDGKTLPDGSFDLIVSYDSLVHADFHVLRDYFRQAATRLAPGGVIAIHHANREDWGSSRPAVTASMIFALVRTLPSLEMVSQTLLRFDRGSFVDCFTVARNRTPRGDGRGRFAGSGIRFVDGASRADAAEPPPLDEVQALWGRLERAEQRLREIDAERNYYRRRWPPYVARRVLDRIRAWRLANGPATRRGGPATDRFGRDARVALVFAGMPAAAETVAAALGRQTRSIERLILPASCAPLDGVESVREIVVRDAPTDVAPLLDSFDYVCILRPEDYGSGPLWSPVALEMAVAGLASDPSLAAIVLVGEVGEPSFGVPNHVHETDSATIESWEERRLAAVYRADALHAARMRLDPAHGLAIRDTLLELVRGGARVAVSPRSFPLEPERAEHCAAECAAALPATPRAPIRALYVTQWLECGGADKGAIDLLGRVDPGVVEFRLMTTLAGAQAWEARVRGSVRETCHLGEHLPLPPDRRFPEFLVEYVRRREIGLVHIMHSFLGYDALPLLKRALPRVRTIDQCHILEPPEIMQGGHAAYSSRRYKHLLDHRTVTSEWLKRYLMATHAIPERDISVIYTGVDWAEEFDPDRLPRGRFRSALGIPDGALLVVFVGRLYHQKRPELFVEIAAEVQRLRPSLDAYFVLVGPGPERERLEQLRRDAPAADRVLLAGAVPHSAPVLRDADLLLIPSRHEGLAFVSYEAMAMGVPPIFTDVNGQAELIDERSGVLIPANPAPAVVRHGADAVVALALDEARRLEMGRAGRRRIREHFGVEQMVARYESLYRDLMRNRP